METCILPQDRNVLRELAKEVAEIAHYPIMEQRKQLWIEHNDLKSARPLILVFPEGAWCELIPSSHLKVKDQRWRWIEGELRRRIYTFRHFADDSVITDEWNVYPVIRHGSWGLEVKRTPSTEHRGAWHYEPVLHSLSDVKKLQIPSIEYQEEETHQQFLFFQDLFGDILKVQKRGIQHISYHLMAQYTAWRGLEEMMMDIYCEPQLIHDVMQFLVDAHTRFLQFYQNHQLLSLNNDNTYQGSGGNGWCQSLPQPDFQGIVRPKDMWASAESQELAQVGPEHHAIFALEYEKKLLAPFGLTAYGCCEDLTKKLSYILTIPNIRRISISPFANVDVCAPILGNRYIFSWKPHPSHLVGQFSEDRIRSYLRHTLEVCKQNGCILEMILKDTHTCDHQPERFDLWTKIAREEVNRIME